MEIVGADPILTIRDTDTGQSTANARIRFAESAGGGDTLDNYWDVGLEPTQSLTFSKNGTEYARFSANGNLGIGTSSPAAPLHVIGNDGVQFNRSGQTNGFLIRPNASTDGIRFTQVGTGDRMTIDSSGKVGIGTDSPSAPLHVIGNDGVQFNRSGQTNGFLIRPNASTDGIRFTQGGTGDRMTLDASGNVGIGTSSPSSFNGGANNLVVGSGSGSEGITIYADNASNSAVFFADTDSTTTGQLNYQHASNAMTFHTNGGSERMRIDSSGNVGIGTSSPDQTLHVWKGNAGGVASASSAVITIENSSDACLQFLTPNTAANQIRFGDVQDNGSGIIEYNHNNAYMAFNTNGPERMRIDSSGNVGIGTSSPQRTLHVHDDSTYIQLTNDTTGTTSSDGFRMGYFTGQTIFTMNQQENDSLAFSTNNTERMRIDSSGNLIVGGTSAAGVTSGGIFYATPSSGVYAAANADNAGYFNRNGGDGSIVEFRAGNARVGSIGCRSSGGNLQIDTVQSGIDFGGDGYLPMRNGAITDNSLDIGSSSFRYQDIYATNDAIQTSDRNEKQDIAELSDAEQRVAVAAKGLLRKFRWRDAVTEKGDEARTHFGIIAQDLQAAFAAEGLDAGDYAMFISSTWTDEETGEERTRMGVRYSELLAFIIAAI